MRIMKIVVELLSYLKAPSPNLKQTSIDKQFLIIIFIISYSIKTIWLLTVNQWIRNSFHVERSEIASPDADTIEFFFLIVVVYPVAEEFIFRYFLKGKKWVTVFIISLVLSFLLVKLTKYIPFPELTTKRIALAFSFCLPLLLGTFFYVKANKSGTLDSLFSRFFHFLFYFSIISFALLHSFNFKISGHPIWLLPMLVPFLVSGAALGFVRMKWGLIASIILHMSFNLVTFILDKGLSI